MRFGCCGAVEDAALFKDLGFDFLEIHIQTLLRGDVDDATWAATAPDVDKVALPIEAGNCLVPGSLPLVGPQCDMDALAIYMQRVAARAKKMGLSILVFGSGGARRRPDDVPAEIAIKQIQAFTRMAAEACDKHGVLLVIEHLNKGEDNMLNSLAQVLALHEKVDHRGCQTLVDSFHFGLENETDQTLLALGDTLRHVHVSEVVDRAEPGAHGDDAEKAFDFKHFFSVIKQLGYDDRMAIEARWQKPVAEAGAASLALLKRAWDA